MAASRLHRRAVPAVLALVLLLGAGLRVIGVSRGWSDLVAVGHRQPPARGAFYHFHPDETTLVDAALQLADPLEPPLTVYGLLPLYALRAALWLSPQPTPPSLAAVGSPAQERCLFTAARALSAVASWLALALVYVLGRRAGSRGVALLATLFAATAPIAIQQAHFYTVDSLFLLWTTAALVALLIGLERSGRRWSVVAGICIGLAAATRLAGLLLLVPAAVAHLALGRGPALARVRQAVTGPRLWLVVAAALGGLLVLQPYLVLQPFGPAAGLTHRDVAGALKIAEGEHLRIWTLGYLHTTPYLYHWTDLWPAGVGWPLTLAFAAGVVAAVARPTWAAAVLLSWCGADFVLIGGMYAKPVRYLLPLLPALSVLAAALCWRACTVRPSLRPLGVVLTVVVAAWSAAYGVAFATSVYATPDVRLQAARFLAEGTPASAWIGVERGAFSMASFVDPERRLDLSIDALFASRPYTTCGAAAVFLEGRLRGADALALIDANRYHHVAAADRVMPGAASFYRHLYSGRLGFTVSRVFAATPRLGPLAFDTPSPEHSFVGFDHPRVLVFARKPDTALAADLAAWRAELTADPRCPDAEARQAAAMILSDRQVEAETALGRLRQDFPDLRLAELMAQRLACGGPCPQAAWEAQVVGAPWSAGLSLADLGLPRLAVQIMGVVASRTPADAEGGVNGLILVANDLWRRSYVTEAAQVYAMANDLRESQRALNRLAQAAYGEGDFELACRYWERSLARDPRQAGVHANLGQTAAKYLGDLPGALAHLRAAVRLDPGLQGDLQGWITDLEAASPQ